MLAGIVCRSYLVDHVAVALAYPESLLPRGIHRLRKPTNRHSPHMGNCGNQSTICVMSLEEEVKVIALIVQGWAWFEPTERKCQQMLQNTYCM